MAAPNPSSCCPNFDEWCKRWKIPTFVIQFCNGLGARVPGDLAELNAKEIEEFLIDKHQLKRIEAKRVRRGYQSVVEAMLGVSSSCVLFFVSVVLSHTD